MRKNLATAILIFLFGFLFAQDDNATKIWYNKHAANWNEALPAGNGRLGAMVFGHPSYERIQLNEESLWAGTKIDNNNPAAGAKINEIRQFLLNGENKKAYDLSEKALMATPPRLRSYQPLGDLFIDFGMLPSIEKYSRHLDLSTGVITTKFQAGAVNYLREVFVSSPQNCIVIRITADKKGAINCKLMLSRERDASVQA